MKPYIRQSLDDLDSDRYMAADKLDRALHAVGSMCKQRLDCMHAHVQQTATIIDASASSSLRLLTLI